MVVVVVVVEVVMVGSEEKECKVEEKRAGIFF